LWIPAAFVKPARKKRARRKISPAGSRTSLSSDNVPAGAVVECLTRSPARGGASHERAQGFVPRGTRGPYSSGEPLFPRGLLSSIITAFRGFDFRDGNSEVAERETCAPATTRANAVEKPRFPAELLLMAFARVGGRDRRRLANRAASPQFTA